MADNCRWYSIADITLQIESDLPMNDGTFSAAINRFAVNQAGDDVVSIHHHFKLPDIGSLDLSREVYRKVPWAIYQTDDGGFTWGFCLRKRGIIPSPLPAAIMRTSTSTAPLLSSS